MKQLIHRFVMAGLVAVSLQGCAGAPGSPAGGAPGPAQPPMQPYTDADVEFISGMIPHHTQAILISGWAPSHEANPQIRTLTERIVVGQSDDLVLMKQWLGDRGKPIPATGGHDHAMQMPGMLTAEQMAQLDAARGTAFDRLFLTLMIQHHQGALQMVNQLFGSSGAANDDFVYKMASEIHAEQETEIERMKLMIASLPSGENGP
jgi:uncharacterized protein (DUF305 family)